MKRLPEKSTGKEARQGVDFIPLFLWLLSFRFVSFHFFIYSFKVFILETKLKKIKFK